MPPPVLAIGDPAPDFALPDQDGRLRTLEDYRGDWLLLYFYPRDRTPGCTTEACGFRDRLASLRALDAAVVGISTDPAARHRAFADRHGLSFPLLADTDGTVARRYGSLWKLGPLRLARRHSFLIDPKGRIARIYRQVNARHHGDEILDDLRDLRRQWAG